MKGATYERSVIRLAREIHSRGLLLFYGTGSSHMLSQRVAIGAGFVPGWWELYTKPIE